MKIFLSSFLFGCILVGCDYIKSEKKYYSNGAVESIWHFENDTLNGVKEGYWENGKLSYRFRYVNGKKSGEFEVFYKNGNIAERGTFIDDLRHGPYFEFFATDSGRVKLEAYIVIVDTSEFYFSCREFNHAGVVVKDQNWLTVNETSKNGLKMLELIYAGQEEYDSALLIAGNFDFRFNELSPSLQDTIKFLNNRIEIERNNITSGSKFFRAKFYGFKNNVKLDTVFSKTNIKFVEIRLR